jgi:hypothetical protein
MLTTPSPPQGCKMIRREIREKELGGFWQYFWLGIGLATLGCACFWIVLAGREFGDCCFSRDP